jgi:probable HAF family extracellular repeat protein
MKTDFTSVSAAACLVIFASIIPEADATSYTFTSFGGAAGTLTQLEDINDASTIVGDINGAGVILQSGNFTTIPVAALGINFAGKIVGNENGPIGVLFVSGTYMTISPPSANSSEANSINDLDQIVGQFTSPTSNMGNTQGFFYNGGTYTTIDFPGAVETGAKGINNSGEIVGFYTDAQDIDHSFLYSGGSFQEIVVPGCISNAAFGINNKGVVVGMCRTATDTKGYVDDHGEFTFLSFMGSETGPHGINDAGQIVGFSLTAFDTAIGFLATPQPVFAGTPGKANCHGQSVSALARKYSGLNSAAAALGFSDVSALQNAILMFCEG